jgi:hypothetical protein
MQTPFGANLKDWKVRAYDSSISDRRTIRIDRNMAYKAQNDGYKGQQSSLKKVKSKIWPNLKIIQKSKVGDDVFSLSHRHC